MGTQSSYISLSWWNKKGKSHPAKSDYEKYATFQVTYIIHYVAALCKKCFAFCMCCFLTHTSLSLCRLHRQPWLLSLGSAGGAGAGHQLASSQPGSRRDLYIHHSISAAAASALIPLGRISLLPGLRLRPLWTLCWGVCKHAHRSRNNSVTLHGLKLYGYFIYFQPAGPSTSYIMIGSTS